eukprot:SAG11_NODE_4386_length_1919_cov_1.358791_1_plen_491_part_01
MKTRYEIWNWCGGAKLALLVICCACKPGPAECRSSSDEAWYKLYSAAERCDLSGTKRALTPGYFAVAADVNRGLPGNGDTALHVAARNSCGDVVQHLVGAGANVRQQNAKGETAAQSALASWGFFQKPTGKNARVLTILSVAEGSSADQNIRELTELFAELDSDDDGYITRDDASQTESKINSMFATSLALGRQGMMLLGLLGPVTYVVYLRALRAVNAAAAAQVRAMNDVGELLRVRERDVREHERQRAVRGAFAHRVAWLSAGGAGVWWRTAVAAQILLRNVHSTGACHYNYIANEALQEARMNGRAGKGASWREPPPEADAAHSSDAPEEEKEEDIWEKRRVQAREEKRQRQEKLRQKREKNREERQRAEQEEREREERERRELREREERARKEQERHTAQLREQRRRERAAREEQERRKREATNMLVFDSQRRACARGRVFDGAGVMLLEEYHGEPCVVLLCQSASGPRPMQYEYAGGCRQLHPGTA